MVDQPRLLDLLGRVRDDVSQLREIGRQDRQALAADPVRLSAVKYRFITAIEGCIRSAHHIAASEGWRRPASNADAFRVISDHSVIDKELAERLGKAAGFRNLLIHQYAEIDDTLVVGFLDSLADLDVFVKAVLAWVAAGEG